MNEVSNSTNKIYHLWWLHDARWYQEVAHEFGFAAANRLNRKILKFIAERVSRNEVRIFTKTKRIEKIDDIIDIFNRCARRMWPEEMVQFKCEILKPNIILVENIRNYALYSLRLADSIDNYECPCLDIRKSWFNSMDINVTQDIINCNLNCNEPCKSIIKIEFNN